jgi:hypothetical protein
MEIWKDIPNYEGLYEVSNLGNVKSLNYNNTCKQKLLKPIYNTYLKVHLCKNGQQKLMTIHSLVAISFLNYKSGGYNVIVDHIDNNKLNNRLDNLQLTSTRHNTSKDKKGYSSKYVGVTWFKQSSKWRALIHVNGKKKHLGLFICELAASNAYQKELKQL